jgi:predicted RNA-binding protein YlxR (DUF448 family)
VTDGPRRTCVGCREVREKRQLVRLVRRPEGVVVVDRTGSVPGRGAYVCGDPRCVERLVKSGRLAQAFKKPCAAGENLIVAVMDLGNVNSTEANSRK